MITAFDHYTVRCADLQTSWRFYADALGLNVAERLGVSAPAAIASIGETQVVHLFQASPEQEQSFGRLAIAHDPATPAWRTGRVQHVGFWARDVAEMKRRLDAHEVPYREREMVEKYQLVVYDPDSTEIEINFPLDQV